jgi:hypothetical protein
MGANFPLPNCGRNDLNDATEYIIGHEKGRSIFKTRPAWAGFRYCGKKENVSVISVDQVSML